MAAASTPLRRLAVFAAGALGLLMLVAVASNAEQFTLGETGTPPGRNILAIESGLAPSETETPKIAKPVDIPESVVIAFSVVLGIGLLYLLSRQRFSFRFRRPSINLTRSAAVEITEEEALHKGTFGIGINAFNGDLIEAESGDPKFLKISFPKGEISAFTWQVF